MDRPFCSGTTVLGGGRRGRATTGDPVNGLKHIDVLKMFNDDPKTEAVIMVGEIGGSDEENAARWVDRLNSLKKVVEGRRSTLSRMDALNGVGGVTSDHSARPKRSCRRYQCALYAD